MPYLPIRLSLQHGKQTARIEVLLDSGAADTIFRADIGTFLGLDVTSGIRSTMGGIVPGQQINVYFHDVILWVGAGMVGIRAAFAPKMSVAAILGRRGFFEHFIVTFDPSAVPPGFDIQRIGRA